MHSKAIELIESEIAKVEVQLADSGGNRALVNRKDSLVTSLRLLRQMSAFEVAPRAVILSLPFPRNRGHLSEYRLMDDEENADRAHWTELEIEGVPLTAMVGDIVILNSEKTR